MNVSNNKQNFSFGLGLRAPHYQDILTTNPDVDWFEILSENYLISGGQPLYYLDQIAERYPIVMHGVSLSIGSVDALDFDYLDNLKKLAIRTKALWLSDHLCWTGVNNINTHDLLPVPLTEESLKHIAARIMQVQDFLEQKILLENPSTYISFKQSSITEWEFLTELHRLTGCYILLDINNIYVNAYNHDLDAYQYINSLPPESVRQIHLAGHNNMGSYIVDTHDSEIIEPVYDLYEHAIKKLGATATMIERDDNIPALSELLAELAVVRSIASCNKLMQFA